LIIGKRKDLAGKNQSVSGEWAIPTLLCHPEIHNALSQSYFVSHKSTMPVPVTLRQPQIHNACPNATPSTTKATMPCPNSTPSAANPQCPVPKLLCQPQIHNALSQCYFVSHKSTMPCPKATLSATNPQCPVPKLLCQPQIHNALSQSYFVSHKSTMPVPMIPCQPQIHNACPSATLSATNTTVTSDPNRSSPVITLQLKSRSISRFYLPTVHSFVTIKVSDGHCRYFYVPLYFMQETLPQSIEYHLEYPKQEPNQRR